MGNDLKVTIDGHPPIQDRFLFALAGSGRYYGGGYCGAPEADPSDGLLDFVLIRRVGSSVWQSYCPSIRKESICGPVPFRIF